MEVPLVALQKGVFAFVLVNYIPPYFSQEFIFLYYGDIAIGVFDDFDCHTESITLHL